MWEEEAWNRWKNPSFTIWRRAIGTVAAQDREVKALQLRPVFWSAISSPSLWCFSCIAEQKSCETFWLKHWRWWHDKEMDCFAPGPGLMPASFKVHDGQREFIADFGESAIACSPVDSLSVVDFTSLCQSHRRYWAGSSIGFPNGNETDPRFGVSSIGLPCILPPSSLQASIRNSSFILCCFGLQKNCYCSEMEVSAIFAVNQRLGALNYPEYYWLDLQRLNEIYRLRVTSLVKKLPIDSFMLNQFPAWLDWGCLENWRLF